MSGNIPPFPQYTFMAWCLLIAGTNLPLPSYVFPEIISSCYLKGAVQLDSSKEMFVDVSPCTSYDFIATTLGVSKLWR
jgi:hypothetical protein